MRSTPTWRKSSRCTPNGGDCVEVAAAPGLGGVRDSKDEGAGPELWLPLTNTLLFTAAIKAGEFG
jgi:Domain of unknown function (DUF397)